MFEYSHPDVPQTSQSGTSSQSGSFLAQLTHSAREFNLPGAGLLLLSSFLCLQVSVFPYIRLVCGAFGQRLITHSLPLSQDGRGLLGDWSPDLLTPRLSTGIPSQFTAHGSFSNCTTMACRGAGESTCQRSASPGILFLEAVPQDHTWRRLLFQVTFPRK